VASTLAGFHRQALVYGVPQGNIMVLATEAMRRATNGGHMLKAIEESTNGLGVHILDPAVETLCGAVMGSRSGLGSVPGGGALFLDLGGGSVQMTWVDTSEPDYELQAASAGISLPFGAARLIRVLKQDDTTVRAEQTEKLSSGLFMAYDNLCQRFPRLQALKDAYIRGEGGLVDVYMCGGGFRGYGSMLMHTDEVQPYPFSTVNSYSVSAARFKEVARMRSMNEAEQGPIFGLSSRRREQFPAIATVIEAFINTVPNLGSVTFCGGSNREGALMMKLPLEIRESNPLDALACVNDADRPALEAIAQILHEAVPSEVDFGGLPTIFSMGLTSLVLSETWSRQGYDADANTSFVLRNAINRDTDVPGLSHRARALLGLTLAARWAGSLSPADTQLSRNLQAIVDREHPNSSFWAFYVGGLLRITADVFPVLPAAAAQLKNDFRQVNLHLLSTLRLTSFTIVFKVASSAFQKRKIVSHQPFSSMPVIIISMLKRCPKDSRKSSIALNGNQRPNSTRRSSSSREDCFLGVGFDDLTGITLIISVMPK
jgi:retrograde regulation protein 2